MTSKWTEDDHAALDALLERFPLTEIIAKAKQQPISDDQVAELNALADECGADIVKLCRYYKIESLAGMKAADFDRAKERIETRRDGGKAMEKRERLFVEKYQDLKNVNTDGVLFLHECAEEYPEGSDGWCHHLELAHSVYLEGRRKRRGRPKKEDAVDHDAGFLGLMELISSRTGVTSPRKLARELVVKLKLVPSSGENEKSQIERLARKYTRLKRGEIVLVRHDYGDTEGMHDVKRADDPGIVRREPTQTK